MSDVAFALRVAASQLEEVGTALVDRFAVLNLWTAVLLGGALVLDRALAHRTRASWRIALYAPVAARVMMPLDWHLRLVSAPRVAELFAPIAHLNRPPADLPMWHPPSWQALAAVLYVAVAAAIAGRAILARVRLARALATAEPVNGPRPVVSCPVVQHETLGPMAVGLLSPRIVLPRQIVAQGDDHILACVLRHEIAHVERRDAWLSAAMQMLGVVAWPVIPLWIAAARVRDLMELACDEAAVDRADPDGRRRYGHALLDIAERQTLAAAPPGAGALHFGSTLRARIEALTSQRHWPVVVQALAITVAPLALFAACGGAAPPPAAPPGGGGDSGYGYQFETDTPKEAAGAKPVGDLPRGPRGRIAPEVIQSAVRAHFGVFRACYASALAKSPTLAGTVSVKYVIREDGATSEAADEQSSIPDKAVVGCVVDEFKKITYPKPVDGVVTVVYPIQFAP